MARARSQPSAAGQPAEHAQGYVVGGAWCIVGRHRAAVLVFIHRESGEETMGHGITATIRRLWAWYCDHFCSHYWRCVAGFSVFVLVVATVALHSAGYPSVLHCRGF